MLNQHSSLRFHIIAGNHDCDAQNNSVRALAACTEANTRVYIHAEFAEDGEFFYPHSGYGETFESATSCILFGHGQMEGLKVNGFELESTGSAMSLMQDVAKRYNRVFLGHIHKPTRLRQTTHGIDVIYPGSVFPCSFGEISERKGFWNLQSDEFVPFDSIDGNDPVCVGEVSIKNGKARLNWGHTKPKSKGQTLVVKIRELDESSSGIAKDVMKRFADRGFIVSSYQRRVRSKTDRATVTLESIKGEINHTEVFDEYVDANYSDHRLLSVVKRSGQKMIEAARK